MNAQASGPARRLLELILSGPHEVDEQQVNLTRFDLFFPEKRDFFLEGLGTFAFAGRASSGVGAGAGDTPYLFTDEYDPDPRADAVALRNRAIVVKFNRLFRL